MKESISFWMKPIFKDKPLTTKINLKIIPCKDINLKTTDYTGFFTKFWSTLSFGISDTFAFIHCIICWMKITEVKGVKQG